MNIFICKVKYDKTQEDGLIKSISEQYAVDALTHTEAEARIIEEMTPFMSGEFSVEGIQKRNIVEMFEGDGDKWYEFKVGFITLDEKTCQEKLTVGVYLLCAPDFYEAVKCVDVALSGGMADYKIMSAKETKYLDYFKHKAE